MLARPASEFPSALQRWCANSAASFGRPPASLLPFEQLVLAATVWLVDLDERVYVCRLIRILCRLAGWLAGWLAGEQGGERLANG